MRKRAFAQAVKRVVKNIPRGSVLSYAEVARRAGFPNAARAVGTLMKNNFDPAIPCHRVIKSDGSLGAYNRGGTKAKERKLRAEGFMPTKKIDVVIYPPAHIRSQARFVSGFLKRRGGLFALGTRARIPHVTIYVADVPTANLRQAIQALRTFAKSHSSLSMHAVGYATSDGWVNVGFKKTKELIRLRKKIALLMKNHGARNVSDYFEPHITFTKFNRDISARTMKNMPVLDFSFQANIIGLFELGEFGTCVKKIGTFPLKDC